MTVQHDFKVDQTRRKNNEFAIVSILSVVVGSALILGVSPLPSAFGIMVCGLLVFINLLAHTKIPTPAFFVLLYLGMIVLSGFAFGGFDAFGQSSPVRWLTNEGRIFLYFWPFLFIIMFLPTATDRVGDRIATLLRAMAVLAFVFSLIGAATGLRTFGSHHAAGAFCAMLLIYHFHAWQTSKSRSSLIYLLLALLAMLATNSRTSLLATVLALLLFLLLTGRITGLLRIVILSVPAMLLMPILFADQFARLAGVFDSNALDSLMRSYQLSLTYGGVELERAWDARNLVAGDGAKNIAIRGYLWGRAVNEALLSPIFGTGFGRFNDLGRTFQGVSYIYYPAIDATQPSASILTAHNTFLHVFNEMGVLGLASLFAILASLWRHIYKAPGDTLWKRVGLTNIICLCLIGMTQHSFGAPIYGITLFLLVGVSYHLCRR